MVPTPRPATPATPQERAATCLETDEVMLKALRANSNAPLIGSVQPPVAMPLAIPRSSPAPMQASRSAPYRPTVRPPIAVLTVFDDGKSDGERIRLRANQFVIGRTEGDLLIPHDGMISGRHVEITRQVVGGVLRWVITDLQSTNGLFVRVSRSALADQSELLVGKGRYRLLAPPAAGTATADFEPPEAVRGSTQAWGGDGGASAIPSLVEIVGNAAANRVLLVGAEYWIGADPSCAICRPNDPYCEARHARLFRDAKGAWHAEHNKAFNGLWFRTPQVVAESVVHFQIGEQRLRLKVGG